MRERGVKQGKKKSQPKDALLSGLLLCRSGALSNVPQNYHIWIKEEGI